MVLNDVILCIQMNWTKTLTAAIKEHLGNGKITGADHAMGVCVGEDMR